MFRCICLSPRVQKLAFHRRCTSFKVDQSHSHAISFSHVGSRVLHFGMNYCEVVERPINYENVRTDTMNHSYCRSPPSIHPILSVSESNFPPPSSHFNFSTIRFPLFSFCPLAPLLSSLSVVPEHFSPSGYKRV